MSSQRRTLKPMFRCPSCAVVYKLPLTNGHSILSSTNMDTWTIEKEPISFGSKVAEVKDLSDLADKFEELGINFINAEAIPCAKCEEVHPFSEYHNAWKTPGDYFDADDLCHCGGELWWDRHPYQPVYAHVCDKCGWVKPKARLNGAE